MTDLATINRLAKFATRDEAIQAGKRPCGECRP